jgi:HEAT repeat protein
MPVTVPRRRARRVAAALVGLVGLGVAAYLLRPGRAAGPPEVAGLVSLLRVPGNQAKVVGHMTPGGELIEYSWPMKRLIDIGDVAREPLHGRLADEGVRNEVALVLGEIGDETTVPLLIEAFPEPQAPPAPFDYANPDPAQVSAICFTRALRELTGQSFGVGRFGPEVEPGTRQQWRDWWAKAHKTFWVRDPSPRPNVTRKTVPDILAQLDTALTNPDARVRADAANGYAQLGPRAAPSVPKLVAAFRDDSPEVRAAAASTFYFIGPDGAATIPALLDLMRRDPVENVRGDAELSLAHVGPSAIPPLVDLLADPSPEARRQAVRAIGEMDPKQRWAIPRFHWLARDPDPKVREAALGYMRVIDPDDPCVFAALVAGLGDPVPAVRQGCAYELGRIGPGAAPATDALFALLSDGDPGVRRETLNAFDEIRSLTAAHVPSLTVALGDESWEVRATAAELLSKIGPAARPAVSALCRGLSDRQGNVRWWSAEALGAIGPEAKPAVPLLVKALADPEDLVRSMAADALKKIDPAAAAVAGVK